MRRAPVWAAGLLALTTLGCLHTPILWSPDGRWVAYTVATRPKGQAVPVGWLFDVDARSADNPARAVGGRAGDLHYRLWATRVDTGESVLLEDGRGPLTSPAWNPEGTALAFARLIPEGRGRARFEVVVQDAPGHQRVFHARVLRTLPPQADLAALPGLALAWSPDGRFLAVPQLEPKGLAILRADNGRHVATIESAFFPAWSPDGSKLAFFRDGDPAGLCWVDASFAEPRTIAPITRSVQPPVWSRDGQSILAVHRTKAAPALQPAAAPGARRPTDAQAAEQAVLVRVRVDNGQMEPLRPLAVEPQPAAGSTLRGVAFSVDREGEELFFSADVEGQPSAITWYRVRDGAVYKLFNPFHTAVPIGALAVAPAGRRLAMRVGPPEALSPPAICNLENDQLTPLAPDDDARAEWLAMILGTVRRVITQTLPAPSVDGQVVDRATLLPAPGEIPAQHQAHYELRRLARIGRPLCDRPADAPPPAPEHATLFAEARLVFDYLLQDYPAALTSLEAVEARTERPEDRLRLLNVRAQIDLARGDLERADAAIAYLRSVRPQAARQVELTPAGPVLTEQPAPGAIWPDFLAERARAIERRQVRSQAGQGQGQEANQAEPDPLDFGNPDAPAANPDQQDQLIPVEPMIRRDGLPGFFPRLGEEAIRPGPGAAPIEVPPAPFPPEIEPPRRGPGR